MALNRYVLTSTVTVAAGTAATPVVGEPATGGAAGWGNTATAAGQGGGLYPQTYLEGTAIVLDPAGALACGHTAGPRFDPGPEDAAPELARQQLADECPDHQGKTGRSGSGSDKPRQPLNWQGFVSLRCCLIAG